MSEHGVSGVPDFPIQALGDWPVRDDPACCPEHVYAWRMMKVALNEINELAQEGYDHSWSHRMKQIADVAQGALREVEGGSE